MAFRDDRQIAAVAKALCDRSSSLRDAHLWTANGPTEHGLELRIGSGDPAWSSSARVLWNLAWALYSQEQTPDLWDVLDTLDGANLRAVGKLLLAYAEHHPEALDEWLGNQRAELGLGVAA